MSLFMHNLIVRHREGGVDAGAVPLVQPRPRARFESDPGLTEFAGNALENGSAVTSPNELERETFAPRHDTQLDKELFPPRSIPGNEATEGSTVSHSLSKSDMAQQPVRQPEFRVDHPAENVGIQVFDQSGPQRFDAEQKIPFRRTDARGERSSRNTAQEVSVGKRSTIKQPPFFDSDEFRQQLQTIQQRLHTQQSGPVDEQPTHHPEQPLGQEGQSLDNTSRKNKDVQSGLLRTEKPIREVNPSSGDFNQRIQEILHRLHAQQGQQDGPVKGNEGLQEKSSLADMGMVLLSGPTETALKSGFPATAIAPGQQGNEKKGSAIPPQQPESHQSGLLQPPSWLPEMQAELHHRHQEENSRAQAQSEPVINVSIGRVEVRATQTTSGNKPKTRQGPSGVMSLDEYLKQRENRR